MEKEKQWLLRRVPNCLPNLEARAASLVVILTSLHNVRNEMNKKNNSVVTKT